MLKNWCCRWQEPWVRASHRFAQNGYEVVVTDIEQKFLENTRG